jgi:hypothetical protein
MSSPWITDPIVRNNRIVAARDVEGDLEILRALCRYGLQCPSDLVAHTGRSPRVIWRRINKLKRKPAVVKICDAQGSQPGIYQNTPKALQLTPKGIARLKEVGFEPQGPTSSIHFIHQLTAAQTAASFEIGARAAGIRYLPFGEIRASSHSPLLKAAIPVKFSCKGTEYDREISPDWTPIGLHYSNDTYRFCVFETDCASEPLTSSNRDRQSIETKFAAYLAVLGQRLFEKHWGFPNIYILFTTTTCTRLEGMMVLLSSMEKDNRLLRYIGFQHFPTILQKKQPAQGWAIRERWSTCAGSLELWK